MKKIRLFCFPYAGGSSAIYNKWRQYLDERIELQAVELSGRGRRIYDPLYDSIDEAVDDIFTRISSELDQIPYAFFGHSMGGIIAYELAQKIKAQKQTEPKHVFFAGRGAPHVHDEDEEEHYFHLPEEEFKKKIIELGGTPKEFFQYPELLDVLLPMLRSDFKIAETYKSSSEVHPFNYDISVLIGKKEEVSAAQMHGWREHTKGVCSLHYFEGEHFFINDEAERIVKIVNNTLLAFA